MIAILERAVAGEEATQFSADTPDIEGKHGGDRRSEGFQVGNAKIRTNLNDASYAHARLRRDRPDIHQRVLDGEITAHAGMVEAGFRKKRARGACIK